MSLYSARLHDAREWSTGPAPERSLDARDLLQESPDAALRECPSGFPRRAAPLIVSTYGRSDPAVHGDSVKKLMLAGLVAVLGFAPVFALAQAQAEEKILVGQVLSVDRLIWRVASGGTALHDSRR